MGCSLQWAYNWSIPNISCRKLHKHMLMRSLPLPSICSFHFFLFMHTTHATVQAMISMTSTMHSMMAAMAPGLGMLAWFVSWALLEFGRGCCVHSRKDTSGTVVPAVPTSAGISSKQSTSLGTETNFNVTSILHTA